MSDLDCPACGKTCGSKSALTAHVRKEHSNDSLVELMAKYGDSAPRPGGAWRPDRPLRAAPSGVPSIDYAIGIGGVPRGTLVEIFGPAGSGKTLTALTFSAYAQQNGGMAGYVDAEHALQITFAQLVPGLNLDTLNYSAPSAKYEKGKLVQGKGERALNITKDFIATGAFDVWSVDSVHALTPEAMMTKAIGADTIAEVAKLMSGACQVLDEVIANTDTVCIFVNHVKAIPAASWGKDWFKPGGSALDYYTSCQLRVQPIKQFKDATGRKIGHTVEITVEKSKVSAPFAKAEYDIYYRPGKIKKPDDPHDGQVVMPGIDIASCWFSVCTEAGLIKASGGKYYHVETGEQLGYRREVMEMLDGDCPLRSEATDLVYSKYASKAETPAPAAA